MQFKIFGFNFLVFTGLLLNVQAIASDSESHPNKPQEAIYQANTEKNTDSSDENIDELKIQYEVTGITDELLDNVEAYLSTLPDIRRGNFGGRKDAIQEEVATALKVYGYYSPKIEMSFKDDKSAILNIDVVPGKSVYIRNVEIVVLGEAMTDRWYMFGLKDVSLKPYTRFQHADYENLKSLMQTRALTMGYFDAHFVRSQVLVNSEENSADISLILDSGHGYHYGDITYNSDEGIECEKLVKPLQTIKKNERFNMDRLSFFSSRLYDTGYFESADVVPDLEHSKDYLVPVNITLQRQKFNIVELGLGYATDEGMRGQVKWLMPLLNNYGHSLNMQMKLSQIKQEALVRYQIPRPNHDPLKNYYYLQAQQSYDDLNDTDSTISEFSVHYINKNIGQWQRDYGLVLHLEDYVQGSESGFATIVGAGSAFNYYSARPRKDPRSGSRYTFKFFGAPTLAGSDYSFIQLYGQAKWLWSPTDDSRLILRFEKGVNLGPDAKSVPPSYRFFTGGDTSVRGFGYKTIADKHADGSFKGGRYLTTGSIEVQVPVMQDLRENFFIDAGEASYSSKLDDVSVGVGTGVRYVSPVGLIKVDLGFGISQTHIPFHLHFGIGPDL